MTHPALASPLAMERYRLLEPHLTDAVSLTNIARCSGIGERTLQRWLQRYHQDGVRGLDRARRSDDGCHRLDKLLLDLVLDAAIRRPRLPISAIHRHVAAVAKAKGLDPPSYSVVGRIVRNVPDAKIAMATDGAAYRDEHEFVYRHEASAPNELWQIDHTVLDILVLDDKGAPARPWLTLVLDDYSRAIAGYFLSLGAPSAINTALALRQAIWRKADPDWIISGIPNVLYADNGSDFVSEHIQQACIALKIRLIHSLPCEDACNCVPLGGVFRFEC